ncbi:MAG: hypothetical protein ACI8XO_002354, partial [Verrucomicrobiales bacterium]
MKTKPHSNWMLVLCVAAFTLSESSRSPAALIDAGTVLIDVNVETLIVGSSPSMLPNTGSVVGNFDLVNQAGQASPAVVEITDSNAVTLKGIDLNRDVLFQNVFKGPASPAALTASGASRSIEVWALNPAITNNGEEMMVAWGRRGGGNGTNMSFGFTNQGDFGAVGHWGATDAPWGTGGSATPSAGDWHHLVYTYDGSTTQLYSDGAAVHSETTGAIDTHDGFPFVIGGQNAQDAPHQVTVTGVGAGSFGGNFSGSVSRVRIHDGVLSSADVLNNFNEGPAQASGPAINSFSATPDSTFEGDNATLAWNIGGVSGSLSVSISPAPGAVPGNPSSGNVAVVPLVTTTYTLTATDDLGSRSADVTVYVDPGTPVANDHDTSTDEDVAKAITLTATDPNSGALTYAIVAAPSNGALTGTAPDVTYTPTGGFIGTDSFTFRANDGVHDSNIATVSITVNAAQVAPTDITLTSAEIPSTAGPGSFIANILVVDANTQDTHAFALVAGAGDDHNTLFNISSNRILAQSDFSGQLGNSFNLRLRATDNTSRSVEKAFVLTVVIASADVVINEIHFDPTDGSLPGEFIELYNPSSAPVNLSQWFFEDGVGFTFPADANIPAGGYLVVAQDPVTALALYGVNAVGPWTGKLSGDGDKLTLRDATGQLIDTVDYKVEFPWPIASGGDGGSMELLHPSLDNDLGSSWRVSRPPNDLPEATLLPLESSTWSWRPGTSEASSPTSAWRERPFVEDGTWNQNAQAPIGYGTVNGVTFNTVITAMQENYSSVFLRNQFTILPGEIPAELLIRSTSDDGIIIWINGAEVERRRYIGEPSLTQPAANQANEGRYETVTRSNPVSFLVEGTNTIAVQLFNTTIGSSDVGVDLEVIRPAAEEQADQPTPGVQNSAFSTQVPPNIRQVNHLPQEPNASQPVLISAKITDPQGVATVTLRYQLVDPGQFIPSHTPRTVAQILADPEGDPPINPDFEDPGNWINLPMSDEGTSGDALAGDGVYSATVPAQINRTLVRYRIEFGDLAGASARAPFPDDRSLNFAYFVYNGVPDFVATTRSIHPDGAGHVWPKEVLTSVPVYHWLIRPQDMQTLQAYNGNEKFSNNGTDAELLARRAYDWEGAMVYDGVVYDHVRSRLRGGNSRYGDFEGRFPNGKRHYKFKFNRGNYFAARDEKGRRYERKWRIFNVSRMFGTKGGNSWGLPEEIGDTLYHTMGVPTQRAHWFHFRVIDGAAEAPDQYNGDFWGIQQAQERYDVRFLESRDMTKGNLYKLSDFYFDAGRQRRYQALGMVSDGSEFDNIRFNLHGGQDATWLNQSVNYEKWYGYSAVGEAIRHYDIFPEPSGRHRLKNLVWYFEPVGSDPTRGVCWELPYDYDASWGPNFNNGWDHANNGLYGHVTVGGQPYIDKPEMKIAHRNVLRSFRDLVWQPDQIGGLLDDRAAFISELTEADRDRWLNAPTSAGTANDDSLASKVQDMKNFAFSGWNGGSGPSVGAGGRGAFLDSIADNPDGGQLPVTPTISYTGGAGHPTDELQFQSGTFSDPQGNGTFAAMEWRVGEIEDPSAPAWDPTDDFIMENDLVWGSGELTQFNATLAVPATALKVGQTYRARVRHKDSTNRWSHWSSPLEFTTNLPTVLGDLQSNLMITEMMYHPGSPTAAELNAGFVGSDFEYLELQNISASLTLELNDVRFTKGIDFDFSAGTILSLAPGEFVLVVQNVAAFELRYGTGFPVAGAWDASQSLSNGGEQVKLSHGSGTAIHDFVYDDSAPWPTAPDGSGTSLVLDDPASAPNHALPASWRASISSAGTPGSSEATGPFPQWMQANGLSDPLDGQLGMPNLLAFALGADLLANPADSAPTFTIVNDGGNEYAAIQFRRRLSATDLVFLVEVSTDLTTWTSEAILFSISSIEDGTETVTVRSIQT